MNGHRPAAITTNGSAAADVGPACRQREQLPVLVVQVDPVLAPVLPIDNELEVPAGQRMERVRHPDTSVPISGSGAVDDAGQRDLRAHHRHPAPGGPRPAADRRRAPSAAGPDRVPSALQHRPAVSSPRPARAGSSRQPAAAPVNLADHQIRRKQVLGGLTREYYIAALPRSAATNAGHGPHRISEPHTMRNAYAVNPDASEARRSPAQTAAASAQPGPMHVIYMYVRAFTADPTDSHVQARTVSCLAGRRRQGW